MPTSYHGFIVDVINQLMWCKPRSILDIGVGFGKWGHLAREYCDVFNAQGYGKHHWRTQIDGIEVFSQYIMEHQRTIYNDIHIGDALKILPELPSYDLIIAGDVLEHFAKDDGWNLLAEIRNKCKYAILLVPLNDAWKQGEVFGNVHETHRAVWTQEDFADADVLKVHKFNTKPIGFAFYRNLVTQPFTDIHASNKWGSDETVSGEGSTKDCTRSVVFELNQLIDSTKPEVFVDVGCGDCNWIFDCDSLANVGYVGVDVVEKLINENRTAFPDREFVFSDPRVSYLPAGDMYLLRDVLGHLSNYDVLRVLRSVQRAAKPGARILATTFVKHEQMNIPNGRWRPIVMCRGPFHFPMPEKIIEERYTGDRVYSDKSLGVWKISSLPDLRKETDGALLRRSRSWN